jgi:hypothetical protein
MFMWVNWKCAHHRGTGRIEFRRRRWRAWSRTSSAALGVSTKPQRGPARNQTEIRSVNTVMHPRGEVGPHADAAGAHRVPERSSTMNENAVSMDAQAIVRRNTEEVQAPGNFNVELFANDCGGCPRRKAR